MRRAHFALTIAVSQLVACASDADPKGSERPAELTQAEYEALLELSPAELPAVPPDVSNRFADNESAARFGQKLFFDPGFAGPLLDGDNDGSAATLGRVHETGKVACAGCHVPASGFLDDRTLGKQISLAAGWGRRKTPSLLDVGHVPVLMWDGRHDALYNQPFGPLESPVEMNGSRLYAAQQIHARYRDEYEELFGPLPPLDDASRFPQLTAERTGCDPNKVDTETHCTGTDHGVPGDQGEFDSLSPEDQDSTTGVVVNMGKALGAYERKLTCGLGRFDRWLHGELDALSDSERRGAQLFVGRGKCVTCHSGPFFSDHQFHNVGLQPKAVAVVFIDAEDPGASRGLTAALADPLNVQGPFSDGDDGRLAEVDPDKLLGAFRTPMLRCVAGRPSFMHTGHLGSLSAVVGFFAKGGDRSGFLGTSELDPLDLTADDQADLVAFLGTLEGPGPLADLLSAPPQP
jgi:cytochrome c peroxidase